MEAAIAVNRQQGHYHHLGKHLMNLGNLYRSFNLPDQAENLLREGTALVEKADDRYWMAVSRRLAAWLAMDRGQHERAMALLEQAAREYGAAGAPIEESAARAELDRIRR
jgi:tetratricopeptide (TPR) repeat protein